MSHLELFLGLGILVVTSKAALLEVIQPTNTSIAVVYTFRGNQVFTVVYGRQYLLVDFSPLVLRYLLWYDCVHICND